MHDDFTMAIATDRTHQLRSEAEHRHLLRLLRADRRSTPLRDRWTALTARRADTSGQLQVLTC